MTPSNKGVTFDFCEICSVDAASVMFYQIQYI